MRWIRLLVVALLLVSGTGEAVTLDGNEPPLADAGLDQRAERGTAVLLDATGSSDPDGGVLGYDWTIRTPDDRTITPDCATCGRTEFVPRRTGEYAVTVRVTDDAGATRTDTLYVTVENGSTPVGPAVTLSGPATPTVDTPATYTATATAGDASLDQLAWQVGNGPTRSTAVNGSDATEELAHIFRSTAATTVRVTLTDTAGRTDTDTLTVNPRTASQPLPPSTPGGPSNGGSIPVTDSARTPVIEGPQLVLGRTLVGNYSLRTPSTANVTDVRWFGDRVHRDSGRQATVRWSPGEHNLFAVVEYATGPDAVANFENGNTNVTADDRPRATVSPTQNANAISGTARGRDAYGNLQAVTVYLDGTEVESSVTDALAGSRDSTGHATDFDSNVSSGDHNLTVVARDARGQVGRETVNFSTAGTPEVVSSGFVNGPVDSFHPRINASRYTAHHILKLQLNGVDPENVSVRYNSRPRKISVRLNESRWSTKYNPSNGTVTYHSLWGSRTVTDLTVVSSWAVERNQVGVTDNVSDSLIVSSSPPEIRTAFPHDGTPNSSNTNQEYTHISEMGIAVDACESFDPDNTSLTYEWHQLVSGTTKEMQSEDCRLGLNASNTYVLRVIDGENRDASEQIRFHDYYVPELRTQTLDRQPNGDSVIVNVTTERYLFTKNKYDVSFGIRSNYSEVDVLSWGAKTIGRDEVENTPGLVANDIGETLYHGQLRVPKSALSSGTPPVQVTVFNDEHPEVATRHLTLDPISTGNTTRIQSVSVNAHYLVQTKGTSRLTVQTREAVESRKQDGYRVVEQRNTGTKYFLEKYTKVANATYETRTKAFAARDYRDTFIGGQLGWKDAGKRTLTETETVTKREWRDNRAGSGTFTGDTRQVMIEDAQYRTKHQYRSERTVTRTKTEYEVRCVIRRCIPFVRTITYTDTVTRTYWAYTGGYGDESTGRSRRTMVQPAQYETQYEYEYTATRERTYEEYLASKEVQTAPAQYEWVSFKTTQQRSTAVYYTKVYEKHSSSETDYRISETKSSPEWIMVRTNGTKTMEVAHPEPSDTVLETRATFEGTTAIVSNSTGNVVKTVPFQIDFSEQSRLTREGLLRLFEEELKTQALRNTSYNEEHS